MLTFVAFKWRVPHAYRSTFTATHVNTLADMIARHYHAPCRFVCVTDDTAGLAPSVEALPLWDDYADVPSPHGSRNPSCYRRLKLFSADMARLLGDRFVSIDLDTVIVDDVTPLFDRPEDFVIWGEMNPKSFYNGSLFLLRAGTRRQVWETFNPHTSPYRTKAAGNFGSDQGWISYCLGRGEATWGTRDGVYSYRVHLKPRRGALPSNARIVHFHGAVDPWMDEAQALEWVRLHWGIAA